MNACYSWVPDCSAPVAACPTGNEVTPAQCAIPWWFWITAGVVTAAVIFKRCEKK